MEPTIIAALVTAAGGLLSGVIGRARETDDTAAAQAKEVINKTYETLRANFTDKCVKVLKIHESGENQRPLKVRSMLYPSLHISIVAMQAFDAEFRYRLEYLRLNGVLTLVGGSEYCITRLGQAFLEEARCKKDYSSVLFGS